uniref:Uncharacterized protein n=1 Tax=Cucumis sativus TaxID=3659 RepID=A0A0A0KEQ8_CUCSA
MNSSLSCDNSVKEQVNLLTKMFTSFVKGEVPKVVSCGVCGLLGHHNDQCPEIKEVSALGGYRRNDSQSNAYNSGWRDDPSLRWGPQEPKHNNTPSTSSSKGTYLEEIVSKLAFSSNNFKSDFEKNLAKLSEYTVSSTGAIKNDVENMKASISELGNKLDQLAIQFLKTEGKGKLPAQPNHANVSAITLRSEKWDRN